MRALLATGADVLEVSKQLVPVDTSSLKESGGVEVIDSTTVAVGYGGPGIYFEGREPEKYAYFIEFGGANPAQPFLRPAFMQAEDTFKSRLKDEVLRST
jgi:hypothetical protein